MDGGKNTPIQVKIGDNKYQQYKKGIGTHGGSEVYTEYANLPQNTYKMVEALVGHQQKNFNRRNETVKVIVKTSESGEWIERAKVSIGADDTAKWIRADISDAVRMSLVVENNNDTVSHINWADAKLYTQLNRSADELLALVADGEKLVKDTEQDTHYTSEARQAFSAAVAEAKVVANDITKDQKEIDAAMKALQDAMIAYKASCGYKIVSIVNGVTNEQIEKYNKPVTVKAPEVQDQKKFTGWKDEKGNLVSKSAIYTYYVMGDTVLTAYYDETAVEEKTNVRVTNYIVTPSKTKAGRYDVKFVIQAFIAKDDITGFSSMGAVWGPSSDKTKEYTAQKCNKQYQCSFTIKGVPGEASIFVNPFVKIGDTTTFTTETEKIYQVK